MYKVKGKYNTALIYTSVVDDKAIEQIETMCDMEIFKDSRIRIMPDVHAGAGCTIGTTMTINGAIVPNMVGVDIGCGMETVMLEEKEIDFAKLDALIKEKIPYGRNVREAAHAYAKEIDLSELRCIDDVEHLAAEARAIGSLGGGNHFIEIDRDEEENLYLVIHSGSRHLGKEVAEIYQDKAYRQLNGMAKEDIEKMIEEYKAQHRENEIEGRLKAMKEELKSDLPKDLAYCTGSVFEDYIHDMKIMQKFADLNRKAMVNEIVEGMGFHIKESFTTVHNYIDMDHMILRKGAVSAQLNEKLLIPINMKDGSLICIGKGNEEWNCSAPHGAGRLYSRSEAMKTFDVEDFKKEMEGIYTTTANAKTLDECPMAYKGMEDIVSNITPAADILKVIRPVYNFKAED